MKSKCLLIGIPLLGFPDGLMAENPAPPAFVIVQPGYPGNTKDAEGFIQKLAAFVGEKAGLKDLSGEYHNDSKPALAAIEKLKPGFAVVSLGFYLEQRKALGLKALLASKPGDNFVLVGREGEIKDISSLKGQAVAGGPLHEAALLGRIVFAGKADVQGWDAKPVFHSSRAVRDLVDRRKYQAVVLTGRDYRALAPLYQTKKLEKILESEYYPPALFVLFEKKPEGAARKEASSRPSAVMSEEMVHKIKEAFSGLPRDLKGKEILETMGAEGFEEIQPGWLRELEGKHNAQAEKK